MAPIGGRLCVELLGDRDAQEDWAGFNAGSAHGWPSVVLGDSSKPDECLADGSDSREVLAQLLGVGVCTSTEFVGRRHGLLALSPQSLASLCLF